MARAAAARRGALHRAHRRGREGVLHRHRPHGADGRRARRHDRRRHRGLGGATPFMFNDPGDNIGPKSCDLWKPVIAAVNGMACGGAFYMLGEVEFIVAAEHATFFDPHVTYGMTAAFEPIHMAGITPFPEIMRLSLLGNYERMSAQRAYQIGMVSEVVPGAELGARARELAAIIASQPRLAIEGTVRAIWSTRSMPQREAVRLGYAYVAMGTNQDSIAEGQKLFASGKRVEWKLRVTKRVAIVGAALSDIGRVDTKTPFELHYQATSRAIADAGPHEGRHRRLRLVRHGPARAGRGLRVPRAAADVDRRHRRRRLDVGVHGRARRRRDPGRPRRGRRARVRLDDARRPQGPPPHREPRLRRPRSGAVRRAVRPLADLEVRDGDPPAHARVRHDDRTTRRDRGQHALQRRLQPRGVLPRPDHDRRGQQQPDDGRPAHEAALLHPQRRRRRGRAHVARSAPATAPSSRCGCSAPARRRATRR